MIYAIHKKYGTIQELPKHSAGWLHKTEWELFTEFPTKKEYFQIIRRSKMTQQDNATIEATLEPKPFRPTVKNVVVNPNMSLDIFFNEQELLPINVELELKFQEPQATKYPFDFAEWMKERNILLHKDGKFYSCGGVVLKDEQVGEFWNEFLGVK